MEGAFLRKELEIVVKMNWNSNNWKVSHIVIKINININKVFLTIK